MMERDFLFVLLKNFIVELYFACERLFLLAFGDFKSKASNFATF